MPKRLLSILILAGAALLGGCAPQHSHHHFTKVNKAVYHTTDGRYCYRGNDDFWFYYMVITQNNSMAYYTTSSTTASSTLPQGGVWEPATTTARPSIPVDEKAIQEPVEVEANGEPISVAEEQMEQTEFDFDAAPSEAGNESSAESSAGESSDGGGDSGGGGDGGGGAE